MTNNELYQKYLYSVFKRNDDETYYFNKKTNEIVPYNKTLEDTSYYDLYYTVKGKFGIYDSNGLYTNEFLYTGKFVCGLNGYILVQRTYSHNIYELYNPEGRLIFSYDNEKENIKENPVLVLEGNKILLKNRYDDNILFTFYLSEEDRQEELACNDTLTLSIYAEFNVSKDMQEKLKQNNNLYHIKYNQNFLMVTALIGQFSLEKTSAIFCKNKMLNYNPNGFIANFDSNRYLVKDQNLQYFDINGNLLSEFKDINAEEYIKIDKIIAKLVQEKRMILRYKDGQLYAFVGEKVYKVCGRYSCNRLLVLGDNNLYGYLDEYASEVIKPQFDFNSIFKEYIKENASFSFDFKHGIAGNHKFAIDVNGNKCDRKGILWNLEFGPNSTDNGILSQKDYQGDFKENVNIKIASKDDCLNYLEHTELEPDDDDYCDAFSAKWYYDYSYYVDYLTLKPVKTKYIPQRQYLNFMVFYIYKGSNGTGYYLYDKKADKYEWLAAKNTPISYYDDYFIINGNFYYVGSRVVNLGKFDIHDKHLNSNSTLLSENEYFGKTANSQTDFNEEINRETSDYYSDEDLIAKYTNQIKMLIEKILFLKQKRKLTKGPRIEVPVDFTVNIAGIKTINSDYRKLLKHFNLLLFDFSGIDVSGLDFSGSNACINPQTVYNKDLSNGNYSDVTFLSYDFRGTNITGATFNNDFVTCYQESKLKRNLTKNS